MQVYNNFHVIGYDKDIGAIECGWYDDTQPIPGQIILRRSHQLPPEVETESWTKAQLVTYFIGRGDVTDVPDIPQWAVEDAEDTYGEYIFRMRRRSRQ